MNTQPNPITKEQVKNFLSSHFVMALATKGEPAPAVAPMVYLPDENLDLYFVTFRQSYKAQNLFKHPYCAFTVWEFGQMSVQGSGQATEVTDPEKITWAMDTFADRATEDPNFWAPIFRIHKGDYVVFRISPSWLRALDLTHNTVRQEESPFTEIKL